MANRFDIFTAKAVRRKDNNGFLIVNATPTRSGIFTYYESDRKGGFTKVRELRHPDEVFRQETLDSMNGILYTVQKNHTSLINPNDARNKAYGFTLADARRVDNHSAVSIKVIDGPEIEAIETAEENGNSLELSNGYTCDVIKEPGEFEGEKYDARQVKILYNHIARVDSARGGKSCRIRLDSNVIGAVSGVEADRIDSEDVSVKPNGESIMKMIQRELPKVVVGDFRLDADEVEFPDEYKGVVDQFKKREKSLINELEGVTEKLDKADEAVTEHKAKFDVMEKESKELKAANEASIPRSDLKIHIKERSKYLNYATQYKLDGAEDMENDDIIKGICLLADKVADKTELDKPEYAKIVFDMLDHEYEKKKLDSKDNLKNHSVDLKSDGELSEFDKAKKRKGA